MNCTRCDVSFSAVPCEPEKAGLCPRCANPVVDLTFGGDKYRYVQYRSGASEILRHGEKWRDTVGDKCIGSLASEVVDARKIIAAIEAAGTLVSMQGIPAPDGAALVPSTAMAELRAAWEQVRVYRMNHGIPVRAVRADIEAGAT